MNPNVPAAARSPRVNYRTASSLALPAMLALQQAVNRCGLEPSLLELVKLRASQLNHCAFCMEMHFREARAQGEREDRLVLLSAWEELDWYTPRERAALRWTEALTRLADGPVTDELFAAVRAHFSEAELTHLTLAIVAINGWNRFSVGFRVPPRFAG
ncbi:MAG: carboxymuconolactone decarboxylase family protein [Verrucomicrobia bacterium]|nr:carboxymuconolactone decarboxylase family protein [Verrucomicrobiota bacterium]